MAVSSKLNTTIATIQSYAVALEHNANYENVKAIVDWMANGGKITQSFDILQLLYSVIPGAGNWEEWLLNQITILILGGPATEAGPAAWEKDKRVENSQFIQKLEMSIKTSLMAICSKMLDCSANPLIPDKFFDSAGTDINKVPNAKQTIGEGIILPLSFIDTMSVLYTPPIGKRGKYCYFDVTDDAWKKVPDKDGQTDEIVYSKQAISPSDMWKSRDFDAFLWYVINRGTQSNAKTIWDNRYKLNKYAINHDNSEFYGDPTETGVRIYNKNRFGDYAVPVYSLDLILGEDWAYNNSGATQKPDKYNSIPKWIKSTQKGSKQGLDKIESFLTENLTKQNNPSYRITVKYTFYEDKEKKKPVGNTRTITYQLPETAITDLGSKTFKSEAYISIDKIEYQNCKRKVFTYTRGGNNKSVFKKKHLARFEYCDINNLGEGGIRMWISPAEYYRTMGFQIGGTNVASNALMLQWDWDFINSIQLYDPFVVVSQLVDAIFNTTSQVTLSFNKEIISGVVGEIVKQVISQDDTKVEDCYFNFSNDQFTALLERAERVRRGYINQTGSLNMDDILDSIANIDTENPESQLAGTITTISREVAFADSIIAATDDSSGGVQVSLLENLLIKLCTPLVAPLFRPKCLVLLAVNLRASGKVIPTTWSEILNILTGIITQVVITIKDMLVQALTNAVLELLEKFIEKVASIIVVEQIECYKQLLEQLYTLFKEWFRIFGSTKGNIDNVNYADIDGDVTMDANEITKC